MKQTHGGNLRDAQARFGGSDWIDLSTGINPVPYPVPEIPETCWTRLPERQDTAHLETVAYQTYEGTQDQCVAAAGTSILIQHLSRIFAQPVAIVAPTYSEHERAFLNHRLIDHPEQAHPHEGLIVVNPNNPDGRTWTREQLGSHPFIIVDESFADVTPVQSLTGHSDLIVLRSFGKFFGLAGLRLGFCLCSNDIATRLRAMMGPWAVSGAALHIGATALQDTDWMTQTRMRLTRDKQRLQRMLPNAVGGTDLFGLYDVGDAQALQNHLAQYHIWTRVFDYNKRWIRLGLPASDQQFVRLERALQHCFSS